MEAEGRSYSELYRNSSEEIFLKSIMESSIAMPAPTMESLGFKNISQSFRADSEELFNNWLMNGESNGSIAHRTRQSSRRISTELAALCSQQNGSAFQTKLSNSSVCQQNLGVVEDSVSDSQRSVRNVVEKGFQASNLFLAKAWFHSSQPMTRSRSSELRRRYAAMQNFQMSAAAANPTQSTMARGENIEIQSGLICDVTMSDRMTNQITTLMSASTPASSPFTTPPMAGSDAVSSVVSMLKGTLERKKQLNSHTDNDNMEDDCYGSYYGAQEVIMTNMSSTNQAATQMQNYPGQSQMHVNNDFMHPENIEEYSVVVEADGFGAPPGNPIQMSTTTASQEPSQSESSAVAPAPSSGFEVCDGPASSGQNFSVCESARRHYGNGSSENGPRAQDSRERIFENNIKDGRKKGSLARLGSVTSAASGEKADPTKKRRVERSRKMAEAKERIMTPAVPSDAQALLKRCENLEKEVRSLKLNLSFMNSENLEKEVRSLKLNLSFMNRKDSEQTKQIEELQKQNKELGEEKERLLEEIERIL